MTYPVKQAVEIHVDTVTNGGIKQDVFSVAIPKSQDVAHHTHDGRSPRVRQTCIIPYEEHQFRHALQSHIKLGHIILDKILKDKEMFIIIIIEKNEQIDMFFFKVSLFVCKQDRLFKSSTLF